VFIGTGAERPTNKMGRGVINAPITFSGGKPYVKFVQRETGQDGDPGLAKRNQDLACSFLNRLASRGRKVGSTQKVQGYVEEGWTALEVADWLDELAYRQHNPDQTSGCYAAFEGFERQLKLGTIALARLEFSLPAMAERYGALYDALEKRNARD